MVDDEQTTYKTTSITQSKYKIYLTFNSIFVCRNETYFEYKNPKNKHRNHNSCPIDYDKRSFCRLHYILHANQNIFVLN